MQRFDTVVITATKTNEGFIRDAPIIGRVGIMRYQNADGSDRYEYRPPEEAFNEDSLASLEGKPITVGHQGMVTASNAGSIQPIGSVLSAGRKDGDNIRADVMIYNLPTSARELSCGYTLDIDETPGETPDGKHYDAVQRNIRYNHVAIVQKGRAGIARLNMDGSQDFMFEDDTTGGSKSMSENMKKVRVDSGIEYDAAPEVAVYVQSLEQKVTESKANMDTLQAKYDAAISDLEKAKKDAKDAEEERKKAFDAAVSTRVEMLDVAKKHKIEKADSMADIDIKKAVIKSVRGDSFDLTDKSEEYINAAFDMAKTETQTHDDSMAKQRQAVNNRHDDGSAQAKKEDSIDDPQAALEKLQQDEADFWMKEVR